MEWILVLWLNSPSNYKVHSEYETKQECMAKEVYYNDIFKQVNTKLKTACVSKDFKRFAKGKSDLVVSNYTVGGYNGR